MYWRGFKWTPFVRVRLRYRPMMSPGASSKEAARIHAELGQAIWIMVGLYEGSMSLKTYPPERVRLRAGRLLAELTELIVDKQPRP
jgi:hypothetical protein